MNSGRGYRLMHYFESTVRFLTEVGAAAVAAAFAAYIRVKDDPQPFTMKKLMVLGAEGIVCGFIAAGVSTIFELNDTRASSGIAAAIGLVGKRTLSDFIVRFAARKVDKS